ncbi:MAG TPA: hypothetical protein VK464_29215 [Symbiobacteriaceae bacterium]|jgi:hypothetical protein|nr:hypothetical protein [Symbiobacteriaceae bacterium]
MNKPTDTILPERAPALGVPLRYFLLGLLYLAGLLLTAIWKAPLLAADYLHNPATLAVTHLFTLGFAGTIVTGAITQMIPVLLHSHLFSERLANGQLAVHGLGVLLMVAGFLQFQTAWVITGGSLVVTGAVLFFLNLGLTFRRAERWNWHGLHIVFAMLYYVATLSWGLVMAFNQRYGFLGEVEGATLTAHLVLGLLGWFSLMIIGVGLKLVPMFAPGKALPAPIVAAAGGSLALGALLTLFGLWYGPVLRWTGLLLTAAALLAYAGLTFYTYLHRRSGPLDFSIRFSLTAAAVMLLPLVGLLLAGREGRAALVMLFALGFIGGTIMGMLLRIIPFMVWLHRFRNRTHKLEKIPFLHELFQPRYGWIAYLTWFPGVALMALGLYVSLGALIVVGALLGLAALGAFAIAVRQILHHVPPGTPPLFPGKPAK